MRTCHFFKWVQLPLLFLLTISGSLFLLPQPQQGATDSPFNIAHAQPAPVSCPNLPGNPAGPDFSNQDLSNMNFSRRDLRGANFSGATLKGTVFIGADLEGANFSNARVQASDRDDLRPTDFTRANLSHACFSNMTFGGRAYFTYADISCADFPAPISLGAWPLSAPAP